MATHAAADIVDDGGGGGAVSIDAAIRDTPEYRAAWDVELWRALQLKKVEKDARAKEKALLEAARTAAQQREQQLIAAAERKLKDAHARELKLVEEGAALERRRAKLVEVERDLKRRAAELEEHRRRVEADADDRVRRVKEDGDHRVAMVSERATQAAEAARAAEERVAQSQKEYLKLWEEFSDFKTKLVTQGGGGPLAQQMDALRAQHSAELATVVERSERRFKEATMQFQLDTQHLNAEIRRLTQNYAHKKEQLKTVSDDAAMLRGQRDELQRENETLRAELGRMAELLRSNSNGHNSNGSQQQPQLQRGNPETAVLRSSVDSARRQLATSAAFLGAQPSGNPPPSPGSGGGGGGARGSFSAGPSAHDSSSGSLPPAAALQRASQQQQQHHHADAAMPSDPASLAHIRENITRWRTERGQLLRHAGGVYDESSPLIVELDSRITTASRQLQQRQQHLSSQ